MRAQRRALWDKQSAIAVTASAEKRAFTAEEQTQWDAYETEMAGLLTTIEAVELHESRHDEFEAALETRAAREDAEAGKPTGTTDLDEVRERAQKAVEIRDNFIRYGLAELDPEDRAYMLAQGHRSKDDGERKPKVAGIEFPIFRLSPVAPQESRQSRVDGRRGHKTVSAELRDLTSGIGGARTVTVPDAPMLAIETALLAFGGMRRSRATIIRSADGRPLPMPTDNDTGNKGQLLGEGSEESNFTDPTLGEVILSAFKYSSKFIRVSIEFLADTSVDASGWIAEKLGTRIGRITNDHYTFGTGSGQPLGVENATIGKTIASISTVTHAEMLDLKHSVDPDYRESPEWMWHDTTLKILKQLVDSQNRPLWLPGIMFGEPDSFDGDPYVINQSVDVMGAAARPILYGDFSKYIIRDVMDITLMRLDERYAEFGKVAFIAFMRTDGDLLDAGTNPIKYIRQPAS